MNWIALILTLLGHIGIWCTIFNLTHATAWPRPLRKLIEAIIYLSVLLIGTWIVVIQSTQWNLFIWNSDWIAGNLYAWFSLLYFLYQLMFWAASRKLKPSDRSQISVESQVVDTLSDKQPPQINGWLTRLAMSIPGNQFAQFSVESKRLFVPELPEELEGLRVAHLSDLHLTGKLDARYFEIALGYCQAFEPDLLCITGDIVDKDGCVEWLEPLFSRIDARQGKFYILGNHDARLRNPESLRAKLESLGFCGVNGRWIDLQVNGTQIRFAGNELPWFPGAESLEAEPASPAALKVLLSHTPDHAYWALSKGFDLVLAGHNHGGQVRFPVIGPIVAPSRFGVRFASGCFLIEQMTMHVSRGLSSDDPIRFDCRPELSLLTLSRGERSELSQRKRHAINLVDSTDHRSAVEIDPAIVNRS